VKFEVGVKSLVNQTHPKGGWHAKEGSAISLTQEYRTSALRLLAFKGRLDPNSGIASREHPRTIVGPFFNE